jgi:hypothetical protein
MGVGAGRGLRRRSSLCRKHRLDVSERRLPRLKEFCLRVGIDMRRTEHGWQFRKLGYGCEYIVNWSPSTNRVRIQYALPGHGRTVPFTGGEGGGPKARILVALEELNELTQRADAVD